MGREKDRIGRYGEEVAADFLRRKGYRILRCNLRTPFGEIDLVALRDEYLVFVEIKTRASPSLGPPSINVTWQKKRSIVKNALWFLANCGKRYSFWRIDVVAVTLDYARTIEKIELIENAVQEDGY